MTLQDYSAVAIAEGFQEAESEEQLIEAWQHLVDTGLCWELQGWFGRQAQAMINEGLLTTPTQHT
jgi:hypothetical protein